MVPLHFDLDIRRKIWHISATLTILPLYFLLKYCFLTSHFLVIAFTAAWSVAILLIVIDLIRMYHSSATEVILSLPLLNFFKLILRQHEERGYAASTYSVLAVALIVSLLFAGFISEQTLIASIIVMALCDPIAAWARSSTKDDSEINRRLAGFIAFVVSCYLILIAVGFFYHMIDADIMLAATIAAAFCEGYIPKLWKVLGDIWKRFFGSPSLPRYLSGLYFDDNLTAPVALALIMALFGF